MTVKSSCSAWKFALLMSPVEVSLPSLASMAAVNMIESACTIGDAICYLSHHWRCFLPSAQTRPFRTPSRFSSTSGEALMVFFLYSLVNASLLIGRKTSTSWNHMSFSWNPSFALFPCFLMPTFEDMWFSSTPTRCYCSSTNSPGNCTLKEIDSTGCLLFNLLWIT